MLDRKSSAPSLGSTPFWYKISKIEETFVGGWVGASAVNEGPTALLRKFPANSLFFPFATLTS